MNYPLTNINSRTRQAVILVGGRGTRLGELSANTPKPLMRITDDKVFLDFLLFNIIRQGFDEILLLAGHLSSQLVERYGHGKLWGARIEIVVEDKPEGTAGALLHAKKFLRETFLLANGDTFFDVNLRSLDAVLHQNPHSTAILALTTVPNAARFGRVDLVGNIIKGFREKILGADSETTGLINAGVGIYRRKITDWISTSPCSIETDIYPQVVRDKSLLGMHIPGYFIDIGLPETLSAAASELPKRHRRPALLLDRDGVLNCDDGYTHRVGDLRWIDGARETIRLANDLGILVIVVTNQAGVAHGYYTVEDVNAFHRKMQEDLASMGAFIDAFYVCPYHSEAKIEQWHHPDHPDRKPNPGMVLRALREWPILADDSCLIGDRESDIVAATRSGLRGILFDGKNLWNVASPILQAMKK